VGSEEKPPLSKEIIMEYARKGAFDNSPLLSTSHAATCPNCRCRPNLVPLEYLKTGEFEIGKTEQIEVFNLLGIMLLAEKETFTPIIVRPICKHCSSSYEVRIVSAEYLKEILARPQVYKSMYA